MKLTEDAVKRLKELLSSMSLAVLRSDDNKYELEARAMDWVALLDSWLNENG